MPATSTLPTRPVSADLVSQGVTKRMFARSWAFAVRLARLCPLRPLALLSAALIYIALKELAYGRRDMVMWALGHGLLALLVSALLMTAAGAIRMWSQLRKDLPVKPILRQEALIPTRSGFAVPALSWWPLVQVTHEVRCQHMLADSSSDLVDGALAEKLWFGGRGQPEVLERWIFVRDPFGFFRWAFVRKERTNVTVWPNRGAVRTLGTLLALHHGDAVPMPLGVFEGDWLEIARYSGVEAARSIHWRAYARTGKLMVRKPERTLAPIHRTLAYLVVGEGDEASAAVLRAAIEDRALGNDWMLGLDSEDTTLSEENAALVAVARSSTRQKISGRVAGTGLVSFARAAETGGPGTYLIFAPPVEGPWLASVRSLWALAPSRVRVVLGVDHLGQLNRVKGLKAFFSPPTNDALVPFDSAGILKVQAALREVPMTLVHRPTGQVIDGSMIHRLLKVGSRPTANRPLPKVQHTSEANG